MGYGWYEGLGAISGGPKQLEKVSSVMSDAGYRDVSSFQIVLSVKGLRGRLNQPPNPRSLNTIFFPALERNLKDDQIGLAFLPMVTFHESLIRM